MKKLSFALLPATLLCYLLMGVVNGLSDVNQDDGPYVQYKDDKVIIQYLMNENGDKKVKRDTVAVDQKTSVVLTVATDEPGKSFEVRLKPSLQNEPTEFDTVNKLFVLSDIEGNFKGLKKLLQANKVIDSAYNWSFGNGHLVLTGDFFDRGDQQTEVLWLIYSLEEKAQNAGGYVHFVLGNHEIMNMSGDLRYVNKKYLENASLLNENYLSLYNEHTELGRWLRTKNVVEKIGDILFLHGGVSAAVNRMAIPVEGINEMVRPYYPDSTYKYDDPRTDTLFSDLGPFWYRGYYAGLPKLGSNQLDSTLQLYNVKHIATGHTVIADTISILFGGKLINTDVHHLKGHSEALLMEDGKYYRATIFGEKFPVQLN